MKKFEISLEGDGTEEINLNELNKDELEHMIQIALQVENYEMCAHLKKFKDKLVLKPKQSEEKIIIPNAN